MSCKSCGIYLHKVPRGDAPRDIDKCGGLPDPWKRVAADHLASGHNGAQVRNLPDGRCITWFPFVHLSTNSSSDQQLSFDVESWSSTFFLHLVHPFRGGARLFAG